MQTHLGHRKSVLIREVSWEWNKGQSEQGVTQSCSIHCSESKSMQWKYSQSHNLPLGGQESSKVVLWVGGGRWFYQVSSSGYRYYYIGHTMQNTWKIIRRQLVKGYKRDILTWCMYRTIKPIYMKKNYGYNMHMCIYPVLHAFTSDYCASAEHRTQPHWTSQPDIRVTGDQITPSMFNHTNTIAAPGAA